MDVLARLWCLIAFFFVWDILCASCSSVSCVGDGLMGGCGESWSYTYHGSGLVFSS